MIQQVFGWLSRGSECINQRQSGSSFSLSSFPSVSSVVDDVLHRMTQWKPLVEAGRLPAALVAKVRPTAPTLHPPTLWKFGPSGYSFIFLGHLKCDCRDFCQDTYTLERHIHCRYSLLLYKVLFYLLIGWSVVVKHWISWKLIAFFIFVSKSNFFIFIIFFWFIFRKKYIFCSCMSAIYSAIKLETWLDLC